MPLTELKRLIERFKQQKDSTPISLPDSNARICAIQEVLDSCTSEVHAFIFFDEHGESELFDAISDEKTSRKISKFLENSTLKILTNDTSRMQLLNFVERISVESEKRLHIAPIPKKLAAQVTKDTLDNEFLLTSESHLIFFSRYSPVNKERLSEVNSFLGLFDIDFHDMLLKYFNAVTNRAEAGEFR
ncbi:hypothetical protein PVK62_17200 [Aliivibrio sp. S3MY1]|uniref:hypothetical protein n=1 Tax=unclassified Aliivibrio TaxID=2645654 RepID=UPI002378C844|nr:MULTISPECIES: hypothetical protein [unclassified Aliivibrio]MDD9197560.1 hypothetical protein [Aliivibrio sp. S3MY1]MDD9200811.1 hypothetical protein [Aliivibrio sp. S2MY1]